MNQKNVEISTGIVFRTILIVAAIWFLYIVRDVIALLFISVIIVSAIEPAVDWLQRKKIPRAISVLGIYIILFVLISFSVSFLIPPIAEQFQDFSQNFPNYSQKFKDSLGSISSFAQTNHVSFNSEQILGNLGGGLSEFSKNIFSKTVGVFSGFISVIVVLSLTFYMSVKEGAINHFIVSIAPEKYKGYASDFTNRIKEKIGKWMLGQVLLMVIIGILDTIGLYLVGVPYALVLGIFAGVMEIIPYMGPIISAIPGIVLGFLVSPTTGLLAFVVYLVAQQFENHVVVPQVMKKAVGLNPIVVILALMAGIKIAGTLGAILAIPVATAFGIFISDFMNKKEA